MANPLSGIAEAEAWSSGVVLPIGWHKVKIEDADDGVTSNGNPQIEMEFGGSQGMIRDWLVVLPTTIGKVKQLLVAIGLDDDAMQALQEELGDLSSDKMTAALAKKLAGKSLAIFVGEEPDNREPGKMRKRVQAYATKPPEGANLATMADTNGLGGSGPTDSDDDIPF